MLIYAHRGASKDYPELTEAAYRGAVEQGADGFECDVRLTRDEIPVLWHNASMQEIASHPGLISEMSYQEIKGIYPDVLTLDDFLDLAITFKKSVLIETKHPVITGNRIEEVVVKILRDRKVLESIGVSVMSFSWSAIEKMRKLDSTIPTTLLLGGRTRWFHARFSSATTIAPSISQLRTHPELISKIEALAKSSAIWTVDDGEDVQMCAALGVDALITNMPARARSFL
jgi:glycerophosphoryl diester phosphodiesterase